MLAGAACAQTPIVLRAARLLDIETGRILKPGEVLVQGDRIVEAAPPSNTPPALKSSTLATALYCPA